MARLKKEISIRLVAEKAGVSLATVSRVLNNRTDVSEEIRKKVSATIASLNFVPSKVVERRRNIGIVLPMEMPVLSEYALQILNGAAGCQEQRDFDVTVIFYQIEQKMKSLLNIIRERRCDAVAIVSGEVITKQIDEIRRSNIPVILINGYSEKNPTSGNISNESASGTRKAIEYLFSLGHRNIGFLCGMLNISANDHLKRLNEYKRVMAEAGIKVPDRWIIKHVPTQYTPQAGVNQCAALLDAAPEITAVFCNNDEMAIGAIRECKRRGLRVPEDISIIGFDDIPISPFISPSLTTVRQPLKEIGARAVEALADFLRGKIQVLPYEIMHTELIIRESCAPLKKRRGSH